MREKEFYNKQSLEEESKEPAIDEEAAEEKSIIDMEPYLEKVSPIEGVFSPKEEVEKLWNAPKEERKQAIAEFKDKLARYTEAWAMCRTAIEERIEDNPDLPKEEMNAIIKEFASNYGFSERHIEAADELVDGYIERHKKVAEVRKKHPNDVDLVNHLTDMDYPEDYEKNFDISVGPMSIDIKCSGLDLKRIYYRDTRITSRNFKFVAIASKSKGDEEIPFTVVNRKQDNEERVKLGIHEQEHIKNQLLQSKFDISEDVHANVRKELNKGVVGFINHKILEEKFHLERDFQDELEGRCNTSILPEKKKFFYKEFMRIERDNAFNETKNEIIAYFKDGSSISRVKSFLIDGNEYDYLEDLRNSNAYGRDRDKEWQETSQEVLVDEYKAIIESAVDAIYDIEEQGGYNRDVIIGMLADKKLANWPKTAKRLLEQKKAA